MESRQQYRCPKCNAGGADSPDKEPWCHLCRKRNIRIRMRPSHDAKILVIDEVGDEWYRYGNIGSYIYLGEYKVIKVTPKGVWIKECYDKDRFILRSSVKRFACPTKELAMVSFVKRKERQLVILESQINNVKEALVNARDPSSLNKPVGLSDENFKM